MSTSKLLKPQIRILVALSKAKRLNKGSIVAKASIAETWVAEYIGTLEKMVSDEVRGSKKLSPAGLVKISDIKVDPEDARGERWYEITAKGRTALKAHLTNGKK